MFLFGEWNDEWSYFYLRKFSFFIMYYLNKISHAQGIPEQAEVPPAAQIPSTVQATNPSAQPAQPASVPPTGPNANPLDLFPQVRKRKIKWLYWFLIGLQVWLEKERSGNLIGCFQTCKLMDLYFYLRVCLI